MKILQILPELQVGGVETGTIDFAKYLIEKGHSSYVISHGGELVSELEANGTKHFTLPVHQKSLWVMVRMVKAVRQIIIDHDIDIVHARSRVPAWIAFFACRKTKAAFITTCHGYYRHPFFSQVMGWAKFVIVPSTVIAKHMRETFHVPFEHIRYIPRSVNLEKFAGLTKEINNPHMPIIAIIGRITPLKGHVYFIRAMAQVVRSYPRARIWIIGDAPKKKPTYKQEVEMSVKRWGLTNHIEFLGNRQDVPQLLAKVDVVVMSSIYPESFGRVMLEAQAAGVPVVATRVGGLMDIIDDNQTGLLVEPKDTEAMAQAVLKILQNANLANNLVQQAKEKIKTHYTLEHMAGQTLAVYEELLRSMNILVIKISSMGDVILVSPSLKALRKKFPQARIYCLVGKEAREALQNCPYVDDLIVYDRKGKDRGWGGLWRLGRQLRDDRFDTVIDFQNNKMSHLLAFLSFAKETHGFHNKKWGFLLSHPVKDYRDDIPAISHQFQILEKLGIPHRDNMYLELWPSDKDRQYVEHLLESEWVGNTQQLVGIHVAASDRWQTKNWPVEYIARLCDLLSTKNIRVVITGTDKDHFFVRQIQARTKAKPAVLVGKTDILQLAALIKRCRVYITPDSAPLHIAAAMQTPFVALFGPTDPLRHMPPAKKFVVLARKLTCTPCYSTYCKILTHACMKGISPEEVLKEVLQLMEEKS